MESDRYGADTSHSLRGSLLPVPALAPTQILIVADEKKTIQALTDRLMQEENFNVLTADDAESGLSQIQTDWPSLVILDLQKREQAFDLCRQVKSDRGTRAIPIIIVAAANEIDDRIAGLEAGADDYVGKPFNPREMALRAKAVLRRGRRTALEVEFVIGAIRLDPARCRVAVDNRQIRLTAVEFKLLRTLIRRPGEVHTREALLIEVRGNGELVESRTIDTHIRRLRQKLGKAAHLVETVRGSGYRLRPA